MQITFFKSTETTTTAVNLGVDAHVLLSIIHIIVSLYR